jgi:hypothetical protein
VVDSAPPLCDNNRPLRLLDARRVFRDLPVVHLAFHSGRTWRELAGVVVFGRAEPLVPEHPALRGVMSAWFEKYRLLLAGGGFRDYAEQVESPGMLRVRPLHMAGWDHALRSSDQDAAQG